MNAIITGVGRKNGIGAAIAYALSKNGINVFLTSCSIHDVNSHIADSKEGAITQYGEIVNACKGYGVNAEFRDYDLQEHKNISSLFDDANGTVGEIDILITCHCIHKADSFGLISPTDVKANFAVNAEANLLLCQEFYKRFSGEQGSIVLFSSTQALERLTGEISYAISKASVPTIVSTLAPIMAEKGITINAVNPGPTDTQDGAYLKPFIENNAFGRVGLPVDAANLVGFLVSENGRWITGQTINSEGCPIRRIEPISPIN